MEIAPKKLWPTGLDAVGVPLKGRIAPAEQALPGRAVGRLSDLGWGGRLRALVGPDAPDAPVPDDVAGAVVEVLKAWAHGDDPWPRRPVGVVAVGSRRRPAAGRLARRADRRGRPAAAARRGHRRPAPPARPGRAATAPSGYAPCTTPSPCRPTWPAALAGLDGPVLLVDDLVDSGWTMTLVARALRRAGAPDVLPLALAVAG